MQPMAMPMAQPRATDCGVPWSRTILEYSQIRFFLSQRLNVMAAVPG